MEGQKRNLEWLGPGFPQTFPLTSCVALDRSLGLSEPLIVELK